MARQNGTWGAGAMLVAAFGGLATPAPVAAQACGALTLNAGQTVNGYITDQYVWSDSGCFPRSAALVRNDPKGGHAKQFTYWVGNGSHVVNESPEGGGFGYIVSHLKDADIAHRHGEDDSPLGSNDNAQYRTVLVGKHAGNFGAEDRHADSITTGTLWTPPSCAIAT